MATNQKLKFSTTLLQSGKTATGIKIPDEIMEKLGGGKKPLVKVTIGGFTYRSAVAVMGGAPMVGVNAQNREAAGVKGGDQIDVTIELDTEKRIVELPTGFQKVLDKNATAKKNFESLSNSKKKALIAPIVNAKTEQTRERNISKALSALDY
ncbi:YdeI/OmpD-associated family protein [Arachidicoccus terrestris]|uniref:YdeI/OmpD-associated family protein n=1 Tax=Arachidicoccus terrestris TaxID=2875539 RepID=UPI001CC7FBC9|nr:YdeI/OmpD-associated family protein [Arachidicoccus terrestris]UAY55444.1 YdeI/OmpD-associated family protein [Arachidicoccus terrestris]